MKRILASGLLILVVSAAAGCDAMTAHTDTVARVGPYELTVDEMVDLLVGNPQIPAQMDVVESVADLWVDYIILAQLAVEDSTLSDVDLQAMVQPYMEQRIFFQLRDQVVTTDTVISEEELRSLYARQAPGTRVRARHILLTAPGGSSPAQRDSVAALADNLRERAAGGEDFAALASEYSTDPGSANQGGDLGWFERGAMVQPFEEAAFALEPGGVSEVVETPFGLHIIKVEDRESPSLDDIGDDFRLQMVNQRRQNSLQDYVTALQEDQEVQVEPGAQEVARNLAENPATAPRGRAANRELVTWDGGSVTARELLTTFRRMPAQQRAQLAGLPDDAVSQLLQDLATNELVLGDAEERGITVPETELDSVRTVIREELARVVSDAGFTVPPVDEETEAEAVERRVRSRIRGILAGQDGLLPLGTLPYILRDQREWRIHNPAFAAVVTELEERRAVPGGPPPESMESDADTTG